MSLGTKSKNHANNTLVSIVIPIYNVEKYLDRCLTSVVNQTYQNLEIILIDDGSPDACPWMCDDWAKKDERIRVIHKENGGLGRARNTGLEVASGAYIYFLDSDDYIVPELIEHALALAEKEAADVVVFGSYHVNSQGRVEDCFLPRTDQNIYSANEILQIFAPAVLGPNPMDSDKSLIFAKSAWSFFYSKNLIDRSNWRFVSEREIISEDTYSFLMLCKDIRKVAVLHEACYFYCMNPNSLSHGYRQDRYARIRHFYLKCVELCNQLQYPDAIRKRCSEPYISNTIAALKQAVVCSNCIRMSLKYVRDIIVDDVLQKVLAEKIQEKNNSTRKILFFAIRHKIAVLVYLLCRLQMLRKK